MSADREGFDLFNKHCRLHFVRGLKNGMWRYLSWWKIVFTDTINRVCSK